MRIQLEGVVGQDVIARDFRDALQGAGDVEILVNSPGGIVTDGIAMYNAIRDHRRKGHQVTARVVGMAASMATYIPMAADVVEIEDNAVWMIHNPWGLAVGDHNDHREQAGILERLAETLAKAYASKSGKPAAEIREMMDAETWLYGSEIVDAGFADRIIDTEDDTDRVDAVARARDRVDMAARAVRRTGTERPHQIAAAIRGEMAAPAGDEDIRVAELQKWTKADPNNARLAAVVEHAIAAGTEEKDVRAQILVAMRDGGAAGLAGEDAEAARLMGVSIGEYQSLLRSMERDKPEPGRGTPVHNAYTAALSDHDREAMQLLNVGETEYREMMAAAPVGITVAGNGWISTEVGE